MNDKLRILTPIRYPVGGIRTYLKYTYGKLDKENLRASFGAAFDSILNMTQKRLSVLEELGLIRENAREIELTLSGRFFARIVAGAFDTYQREFEKTGQNQPSSLII